MRQEMYKLVGSQVQKYDGCAIVKDGRVYSSPDEDMLRSVGFLPMGASEIPDFDPATHTMRVNHYSLSDDGEEILAHYVVEELPPEPVSEPSVEERLDALEQAGLERDMALIELAALMTGGM